MHVKKFLCFLLVVLFKHSVTQGEDVTKANKLYWSQYLKMISSNENITKEIDKMGPSILIYPALQINEAINREKISITLSDILRLSPLYMTYAQGRVLFEGLLQNEELKKKSNRSVLNELKNDYYFSIPSSAIITSQQDERESDVEYVEPILDYYHKLLPAQRYALLWALTRVDSHEFEDILATLSKYDANSQLGTQPKPYSLLRLASPSVFEKYNSMYKGTVHHHQEKMVNDIREWLFYGTVCQNVDKVDPLEIVSFIHTFNLVYSLDTSLTVTPLRLGYRKCLVDKIKMYTNLKRQLPNYDTSKSVLSSSQISDIGGRVLSGIGVNDILSYVGNDTDALQAWRNEIGKLKFPELMALYANNVAETANWFYEQQIGISKTNVLTSFGSLAFFLPIHVLEKIDSSSIQRFVEIEIKANSSQNCFCLPEENRKVWAGLLKRAYGPVEHWSTDNLIGAGNLLWVLDEEDFKRMEHNNFARATPVLLKNTCLGGKLQFSSFPGRYDVTSFCDACRMWLPDDDATSFKSSEKVLLRKLLVNSQLLVDQALSYQKNTTSESIIDQNYVNATEVKDVYDRTTAKVHDSWQRLQDAQRLELETVIDKISYDQKTGLSNIFGIDISEIPKNSSTFKDYYEGLIRGRVLTESQRSQIVELATLNKIEYVKEMIRIFDFKENDYKLDRNIFCKYAECLSSKNNLEKQAKLDFRKVKQEDIEVWINTETIKQPEFSCNGIVAAGTSALSLSMNDVKNWSSEQLFNCIDVFGQIQWPYDTKKSMWNLLKDKTGPMIMNKAILKDEVALFLNRMLEVVATENLEMLGLSSNFSVDFLSLLGQQHLDEYTIGNIGHKYVHENALNGTSEFTEDKILEFASLGEIICGFPTNLVSKYASSPNGKKLDLLSLFGSNVKRCYNAETLKMLANMFEEQSSGKWTPESVSTLGIIVAGLEPEALSNLSAESLAAITPPAMHQLSNAHYESLRIANKLEYIPMEFAINVNELRSKLLDSINSDPDRSDSVKLPPEQPLKDSGEPIWKSWELWVGVGIGILLLIILVSLISYCACKKSKSGEQTEENPPIALQDKSNKS